MEPITTAALITAGSSLLGGAMGSGMFSGNRSGKFDEQWANDQTVLQNQVRWRRNDAINAGLHPLFALGQNAASPSSSFSGSVVNDAPLGEGIAAAGRDIARGLLSKEEKALDQIQLQLAQQQLTEGDARIDLLRSQAARERVEAFRNSSPWVKPSDTIDPTVDGHFAVIRPQPSTEVPMTVSELSPKAQSVNEGSQNAWSSFTWDDTGWRMLLPAAQGQGMSESLESLSESIPLMAMVIQRNIDEFGEAWADQAARRMAGVKGFMEALDMVNRAKDKAVGAVEGFFNWFKPDSSRRDH